MLDLLEIPLLVILPQFFCSDAPVRSRREEGPQRISALNGAFSGFRKGSC